jgi:CheY-like chemotaxis protein
MYQEKVRVLLVEDNPRDIEIIRRMLGNYKRAEFEVHAADTAEQGLEQLQSDEFDVILLDYMLPGQDGLRFLARVGDDPDVPPVVMLTAQGDERIAVQAMSLGAYDYFPKSSIVSEILGQRSTRRWRSTVSTTSWRARSRSSSPWRPPWRPRTHSR